MDKKRRPLGIAASQRKRVQEAQEKVNNTFPNGWKAKALLDLAQLASEGVDIDIEGLIDIDTSLNKSLTIDKNESSLNRQDYVDLYGEGFCLSAELADSFISTTFLLIDAAIKCCNAALEGESWVNKGTSIEEMDRETIQCLRGQAKLTKLMHQPQRCYELIKPTLKSAMKDLDASNSVEVYRTITPLVHWIARIGDECSENVEKKVINEWVASKWQLLLNDNESDAEALEGLGFIELSMSNAYLEPIEEMEEIKEETNAVIQAENHLKKAIEYFMKAYEVQKGDSISENLFMMLAEAKISLVNLKSKDKQSEEYKNVLKQLREIGLNQSGQLPDHLQDILNEFDTL
ncbi:hypothetical protein T552_01215 [Pneumocystis carinii B80]|uniref:Enhancer of translation termination 1 n=1 Tax=Pneumocystis carinii (strain B80) TaxID=1408658 RepID=A0A0W4ZLK3_PNEC8|nr:hypothetical protein T552_01215 [Pneumocystis carinii B80]KTW29260.1 hypothetical protein T552_01215 [Pneumocystis carinii B80]